MLSIQEAGKEILTGHPCKFYVFAGDEYGVKDKYLLALKSHYSDYVEAGLSVFVGNSFPKKSTGDPTLNCIRSDE